MQSGIYEEDRTETPEFIGYLTFFPSCFSAETALNQYKIEALTYELRKQ